MGKNWLAKYILTLNHDNMVNYEEGMEIDEKGSILIICDNELLIKYHHDLQCFKDRIYAFNIIYYYFYENAIWFETLKKQKEKNNICAIATGISAIRDAVQYDSILNLANTSQDIFYDLQLLKKYGEIYHDNIQFVIMGLGPFTLCYDMSTKEKIDQLSLLYYPETATLHNKKYSDFYELYFRLESSKLKDMLSEFNVEECFDQFYFSKYKRMFNLGNLEFDENRLNTQEKEKIKEHIEELFYSHSRRDTVDENKEYIIEYFEFCKEHDFPIIILYPPYSQCFKQHIDKDIFSEVKNYILSYKDIYNLEILDLSDLELPDNMFFDYMHLNKKGTNYVREYLDKSIERVTKERRI